MKWNNTFMIALFHADVTSFLPDYTKATFLKELDKVASRKNRELSH